MRKIKRKMPRAEYDALLAFQGGVCGICQNPPKRIRLSVDHDHKTGEIRGLLCAWCNRKILGSAHDSLSKLQSAVDYLSNPPARVFERS